MNLTAGRLAAAVGMPVERGALWLPDILETVDRFFLNTTTRLASFLAQTGHESASFARLEEGLNYSAEGLVKTWPKRFTAEPVLGSTVKCAKDYARNPQKIANYVYAYRGGNGDEASGDGWKYRGKGLIQVTFLENHVRCGHYLNLPLREQPELLLQPRNAALSAGWFWVTNGLNSLADEGDFVALTKKINGGTHGMEDRAARLVRAMEALSRA